MHSHLQNFFDNRDKIREMDIKVMDCFTVFLRNTNSSESPLKHRTNYLSQKC